MNFRESNQPSERMTTMSPKAWLTLGIATAAFAIPTLFASTASAAECTKFVLCPGNSTASKLRDDLETEKHFGADILATNTRGSFQIGAKFEGTNIGNTTPTGSGFLGVKIDKNPESSSLVCRAASGWVEFADLSDTFESPLYSGTGPTAAEGGGNGPWPLTVNSDKAGCEAAKRGRVAISNVSVFITKFLGGATTITGTLVGSFEQPGTNCPAGGIKFDVNQPEAIVKVAGLGSFEAYVDAGEPSSNAYMCFVSSNNALYTETPFAPIWHLKAGLSIMKD